MDFNKVFVEFILEPLIEIVSEEFKKVAINFDKHSGEESFLFNIISDDFVEFRIRGQIRDYEISIVYDIQLGGVYDLSKIVYLSNIAERMKRLVDNNREFILWATWVRADGTWGNTTHTWSSNENTYLWGGGYIDNIDYSQDDVEDEHYQVKMNFRCYREEII